MKALTPKTQKRMLIAIGTLVGLFLILWIVGMALPRMRQVQLVVYFKAPPHKVYGAVADIKGQVHWRSDLKQVIWLEDSTWTEVPKRGTPITFKATTQAASQVFVMTIVAPQGLQGTWTGTFVATETGGTRLSFQEVISIDAPLGRLVSYVFFDLNAAMDRYVADLKQHLGEAIQP